MPAQKRRLCRNQERVSVGFSEIASFRMVFQIEFFNPISGVSHGVSTGLPCALGGFSYRPAAAG